MELLSCRRETHGGFVFANVCGANGSVVLFGQKGVTQQRGEERKRKSRRTLLQFFVSCCFLRFWLVMGVGGQRTWLGAGRNPTKSAPRARTEFWGVGPVTSTLCRYMKNASRSSATITAGEGETKLKTANVIKLTAQVHSTTQTYELVLIYIYIYPLIPAFRIEVECQNNSPHSNI